MWDFITLVLIFSLGLILGSAGITTTDWRLYAVMVIICSVRLIDLNTR